MYFEPSRKTYYRFPSVNSIHEMDSKYYFPDKPYASGENIRQEARTSQASADSESFVLFK
ncbi:MAG TPA: hypothetical protein VN258_13570 [Mobilitalea sp.]|nr:hypothetical protein [Mobilitalea sp.]